MNITLHQINAFVAIIEQGSVQAAANKLYKTHPSIVTSVKKLEAQLGFPLFDRSGYRSIPTGQGKAFYQQCLQVLNEVHDLKSLSTHLQENKETEISIAIGDITPLTPVLSLLHEFTENNKTTHLNLLFENLEGANERLFEDKANIIIHNIDKSDIRYDYHNFCKVTIVPVVAKGFLNTAITPKLKYDDLKKYTQCIIRSTAQTTPSNDYFILKNSPYMTVGDQHTKKEIILQKMAWGHMPLFLVEKELESGELQSIEGDYIKSTTLDIVVARLQNSQHGLITECLWKKLTNAGFET
ncbi:MAG: LysR family transcriptional regulator [Gammaproteobacteria bacterium]